MAIYLTQPPDFNPVRNPVQVGMATSGPVDTVGYAPDFTITVALGPAPAGQVVTLTFGTVDVVLTQASSPNALLGQYDGTTTAQIATSLAAALAANYFISTHFTVNIVSASVVQLIGYDIGTTYGLTGGVITLNSPTILGISGFGPGGTTGIDEVPIPNYGALLQIWVEETFLSEEYTLKLEEVYPVDEDFNAACDISKVLRGYLPQPYVPAPGLVHPARMVGSFKRYTVKVAERYGDPVATQGLVRAEGLFAYLAGRSEVARTNEPDWEDQLLNGSNLQRFLTNWPNTSQLRPKRIGVNQREFLSMVVVEDALRLRLKADLYFTDFTMATLTNLDTYLGEDDVVRGEMVIFPVGIGQQSIEAMAPSKTLERYCVYVTDTDNVAITEKRWYVVDREHREYYRQFHYLNTPGGYDTLAFFGPRSNEVRVDMDRANRYVPNIPTDILDARDNTDVLNALDTIMELGTEHLNQDEMEALRDLVASERIIERVGAEHWPVQVLDTKMKLGNEADHKGPVKLKYRYALRNTANTLQQ